MDACFMVVVREDRVKHIEILKGKCTIECLHKIAKFVVSITEREWTFTNMLYIHALWNMVDFVLYSIYCLYK